MVSGKLVVSMVLPVPGVKPTGPYSNSHSDSVPTGLQFRSAEERSLPVTTKLLGSGQVGDAVMLTSSIQISPAKVPPDRATNRAFITPV